MLCVLNDFLRSAESEFEAPQSFIGDGCPAQVQVGKAVLSATPDGFPHQQVIRAQMAEFQVGSSEFIKGVAALQEKNRRGHGLLLPAHQGYKPAIPADDMTVEVFEKKQRLRR